MVTIVSIPLKSGRFVIKIVIAQMYSDVVSIPLKSGRFVIQKLYDYRRPQKVSIPLKSGRFVIWIREKKGDVNGFQSP